MRLTPKQILTRLKDRSLSKVVGIEKLISIIEKSDDHRERLEALEKFKVLHFSEENVFNLMENLLISDSSEKVRLIAAEIIRDDFLSHSYNPMQWALYHESSPKCLKIIYETLIAAIKRLENNGSALNKRILLSLINQIEKKEFLIELNVLREKKGINNINHIELIEILINYFTIIYFEKLFWRIKYEIDNLRISKLNFIFKGLVSLPSALQNLDSLNSLIFRYNQISKIPEWIGSLRSLEFLNFNVNEIDSLPDSIGDLKQLRELHLWKNNLEEVPASIGRLRSLEVLNLRLNYINDLPASISKLHSLKNLNLHDNRLKLLPDSIGDLNSLKKLNLSWNKLESLPPSIGDLSSLKALDLGRNKLIEVPASIRKLQSLEILNLSENKLRSIPDLSKLRYLRRLNLFRNKFSKLPEGIKSLPNLRELYVGENPFESYSSDITSLKQHGVKIYF